MNDTQRHISAYSPRLLFSTGINPFSIHRSILKTTHPRAKSNPEINYSTNMTNPTMTYASEDLAVQLAEAMRDNHPTEYILTRPKSIAGSRAIVARRRIDNTDSYSTMNGRYSIGNRMFFRPLISPTSSPQPFMQSLLMPPLHLSATSSLRKGCGAPPRLNYPPILHIPPPPDVDIQACQRTEDMCPPSPTPSTFLFDMPVANENDTTASCLTSFDNHYYPITITLSGPCRHEEESREGLMDLGRPGRRTGAEQKTVWD